VNNLRWATISENTRNSIKKITNTSGYIGVNYHKNKWRASIRINGKTKHIGSFETAEEASKAYQEQAKLHFGEFYNSE
jgi:hypothetical protein